jgi:histone H3/H4
MDGLSALLVAASVAQFIEFGCCLVSKSHEIYKSANRATIEQAEMELATKRLVELSTTLKASRLLQQEHSSNKGLALEAICTGCIDVSNQLLGHLEKLKVRDGQNRKWSSFRQALKSVWSKAAIDELSERLERYQRELDSYILVSLR